MIGGAIGDLVFRGRYGLVRINNGLGYHEMRDKLAIYMEDLIFHWAGKECAKARVFWATGHATCSYSQLDFMRALTHQEMAELSAVHLCAEGYYWGDRWITFARNLCLAPDSLVGL